MTMRVSLLECTATAMDCCLTKRCSDGYVPAGMHDTSGQPSPNICCRRYWHWFVTMHPHERVFGNKASVNNLILP